MPAPGAIVLALSEDKDIVSIVAPLARLAPGGALFATRTRSERAMPSERIASASTTAGMRAGMAPDVPTACRMALEATGDEAPVLLTGSLFAVGEAMEAFGGAPGELL
jgi:dihydrofolate synthase/folylpolyglutamate synthase